MRRLLKKVNKPYSGFFLTVEGGDGCGKTTLCTELREELAKKGACVIRTREPGGTPLAEKVRSLLLDTAHNVAICERAEMLLFLTARVQHLHELILPALHAGKIVICERFNDSTLAYQAYARHLGESDVEKICDLVCEHITPDCTLLLDLDPEIALSRLKQKDRLEQEVLQFHKDVRQGFLHLHDKYPERIKLIDASQPREKVLQEALHAIETTCLNV